MATSLYDREMERKEIYVFLERTRSQLAQVSLELLSKGRQLADEAGWELTGLLLGNQIEGLATEVFDYGADRVVIVDDAKLEPFTVDVFTHVSYQIIKDFKPGIFLLGATINGRDLAGRLAVRLRTGLNADCTGLRMNSGSGVLVCEVSGFGGGILALIEMQNHRPQMATVRPGVFLPHRSGRRPNAQVIRLEIDIPEAVARTQVIERVLSEGVDLAKAPVLVAGGRGMDGDFKILEQLAGLLNGDFGATRPPVDDGFVPRERQVGQTGVVCRPDVAIACGISGAFHFVVGIQDAGTIIAINSDPEAPIFEFADYGVVADVGQILPLLLERLELGVPAGRASV